MVDGDPHIFEAASDGDGGPFDTILAALGLMLWSQGLFLLCEAAI